MNYFLIIMIDSVLLLTLGTIQVKPFLRILLWSLATRFDTKVTTIEGHRNLNTYKHKEFLGCLKAQELKHPPVKKSKSVAFKAVQEHEGDSGAGDEELVSSH